MRIIRWLSALWHLSDTAETVSVLMSDKLDLDERRARTLAARTAAAAARDLPEESQTPLPFSSGAVGMGQRSKRAGVR